MQVHYRCIRCSTFLITTCPDYINLISAYRINNVVLTKSNIGLNLNFINSKICSELNLKCLNFIYLLRNKYLIINLIGPLGINLCIM